MPDDHRQTLLSMDVYVNYWPLRQEDLLPTIVVMASLTAIAAIVYFALTLSKRRK